MGGRVSWGRGGMRGLLAPSWHSVPDTRAVLHRASLGSQLGEGVQRRNLELTQPVPVGSCMHGSCLGTALPRPWGRGPGWSSARCSRSPGESSDLEPSSPSPLIDGDIKVSQGQCSGLSGQSPTHPASGRLGAQLSQGLAWTPAGCRLWWPPCLQLPGPACLPPPRTTHTVG